jgi:hypothetical protein
MGAPGEPLSVEGAALLDAGRAVEAVDLLRQAVATGESSAPDLLVRAYLDSGSWRAAIEWLTPLVEQGQVHYAGRLGVALAAAGDRERAEATLRLAVGSGELGAANDLAILLRDEGRLREALLVLADAAADDRQAAANLVALHLEAGELDAAARAAEQHADETRPDTLVALADVRALQGSGAEAEALYRRAVELGALRAHTAYGDFLLGVHGDAVGAEREYREACAYGEPGCAFTLGRFLLDADRGEEARPFLQLALDAGDQAAADAFVELDGEDQTDY